MAPTINVVKVWKYQTYSISNINWEGENYWEGKNKFTQKSFSWVVPVLCLFSLQNVLLQMIYKNRETL